MLTWTQVKACGISRRQTRRLLREDGWSSPFRGTFLLPGAHPVRGPARAALVGRPQAVVCGVTAARLHGLDGLPALRTPPTAHGPGPAGPPRPVGPGASPGPGPSPRLAPPAGLSRPPDQAGESARSGPPDPWVTLAEPVHLLLPRKSGAGGAPGIMLHFADRGPDEWGLWRGIPVTTVERTLADLVLDSDRETAIGILDAALARRRIVSVDGVRAAVARRHGVGARRGWFDLVDGRSESPLETRLRLLLTDAGLTPEQLQWPVDLTAVSHHPGPKVAWLDLAWPRHQLSVEADGAAFHRAPDALFQDRVRQNALLELGWQLLRFTWWDVVSRAAYVVTSVAGMLRQLRPQLPRRNAAGT